MGTLAESRQVLTYVWTHPANRNARLSAVARAISFQVRARLHRPVRARIGERSHIWVDLHEHGASKVVYANPPDWPEMQAWRRLLHPGDLFVDVGSNAGTYAVWTAEAGAEVIAVEPHPDAVRRLRRNVLLNGLQATIVECALAAAPGTMHLTAGLDSMNHLTFEADETSIVVSVRTFDELIGDRRVSGAKIDVEGAERLVLEGARQALAERRIDVLQLEWNQLSEQSLGETRAPVVELLREYGYRFMRPTDDGVLQPVDHLGYGADLFAVSPHRELLRPAS